MSPTGRASFASSCTAPPAPSRHRSHVPRRPGSRAAARGASRPPRMFGRGLEPSPAAPARPRRPRPEYWAIRPNTPEYPTGRLSRCTLRRTSRSTRCSSWVSASRARRASLAAGLSRRARPRRPRPTRRPNMPRPCPHSTGHRVAAAAQVLGMGHARAISTPNALSSPPVAPVAARATMGATTHLPSGASERGIHTPLLCGQSFGLYDAVSRIGDA